MAPDTTVRCRTCGAMRSVNTEMAVRWAWPLCCGQVMYVTETSKMRHRIAVRVN